MKTEAIVAEVAKKFDIPENDAIRRYLYRVREMVIPRLSTESARVWAGLVPIFYGKYTDVPWYMKDPQSMFNKLQGYVPLAETMQDPYTYEPSLITMYSDSIQGVDHKIPYGRILAFTVIHELAHAALGTNPATNQHELPLWAKHAQDMGIKEKIFSMKGPDWKYMYEFQDQELWAKIQALPNYPGDEYPVMWYEHEFNPNAVLDGMLP